MIDPYDAEEVAVQINEDKYTSGDIAREFIRVKPHLLALSYAILKSNNGSYNNLMNLVDDSIQNNCARNGKKEDGK